MVFYGYAIRLQLYLSMQNSEWGVLSENFAVSLTIAQVLRTPLVNYNSLILIVKAVTFAQILTNR